MQSPQEPLMTLEAERRLSCATLQLICFNRLLPQETQLSRNNSYWLDLCVTPRPNNARASYFERWGPHRYERIGDIFMVPPGEAFRVRADSGGRQASIVCQIDADAIDRRFGETVEWTDRRLEACLDIASPHIRSLLFRLAEEVRHPGFASEELLELLLNQLIIDLCRVLKVIADGPVAGGLASWRLRLIDERLREVRVPPTLAELADLCNVSIRQLTRGFRTSRGCSIGDYITQTRVDMAKRLLATDETIKSIAYSMGYASPSNFSYSFRRATGATPRQYRQRLQRVVR